MNDHLKLFELEDFATLDDIKKRYKVLAKQYHPDTSKRDTTEQFIRLNKSFTWLMENHIPKSKSKVVRPISWGAPQGKNIYHRIIEQEHKGTPFLNIYYFLLPRQALDEDATIYCMDWQGIYDFNFNLPAGTKLPHTEHLIVDGQKLKLKIYSE